MITKANESQTSEIKALWQVCYPKEQQSYIDYFFKNLYEPDHCYICMEEGKIVACLIRNPHEVMFNRKVLATSMIVGVATLPEYRDRGYMQSLMNIVMDACEHSELVTLVKTEKPALYAGYGFDMVYTRTQYTLHRQDCRPTTNFGCSFNPTAIDLLKVYSAFIRRFNGFYTRDLAYFEKYMKEIRIQGGKFVAYYNGKDQIQGYVAMIPNGNEMIAQEIIYLDGITLMKLVNAALQEKKTVQLLVSEAEDLSKVFHDAESREYGTIMMKLNDPVLFSKLYGKKIDNLEDVMKLSDKPMNLNEFA